MKKTHKLALIGFMAGGMCSTVQAENELFYPETRTVNGMKSISTVIQALEKNDSVEYIEMIGLNVAALQPKEKSLNLNLAKDLQLKTTQSQSYAIDDESYAWVGEIDLGIHKRSKPIDDAAVINANQAVFMVSGHRVFGQIIIEDLVYEIRTMENGDGYLLVKRDFSVLSSKDDTPENEFPWQNTADRGGAKAASNVVDVIQLITDQAINDAGGVSSAVDAMRFFITQSNQVYGNNGLDLEMRNAGLYRAGAELNTSSGTMLSRLRGTNDGYLDNVPGTLRNQTNADLVVLVTTSLRNQGLCGQADGIGVSQSRAFFVIDHDCTDYTFVHEAGHLFGARHDNDPTGTPYSYGRGFVSSAGNFRTVMAVSSNPQPRIAGFSNPNQTYGGRAIGTSSRDNRRVHANRASTVAGFR
ncbi:M12 family metallo-peptidase [Marinicella litoralis]|uniref:Peptidyl-Asp metalloendopeptidase n=1 Tax=Marinicella litoralis TaxID=644220 RepID=A0A4R6XLZ5_9GAMM|nr:M12 family metallo-peptidase [Marinicella litoralis]TDR19369.1 peptidyl-Asp metalloendopeptidase [Marinicella litoralis]